MEFFFFGRAGYLNQRYLLILKLRSWGIKNPTQLLNLLQKLIKC